jgi:hypothetical protein
MHAGLEHSPDLVCVHAPPSWQSLLMFTPRNSSVGHVLHLFVDHSVEIFPGREAFEQEVRDMVALCPCTWMLKVEKEEELHSLSVSLQQPH